MMKVTVASLLLASTMVAGTASAATVSISVTSFGTSPNLALAATTQAAFHDGDIRGTEDFEGFALGDAGVPFDSAVGLIDRIGPAGTGSGNTVQGDPTDLQIRNDGAGSRFNTTAGGDQYLDSNDNAGITIGIPGSTAFSSFDRVSFFTTDVDDVQSVFFEVSAGGSDVAVTTLDLASELGGGLRPNGELLLFTLAFSELVSDVKVDMFATAEGDGFGIDDVTVSAVPLPAAAWMLIAGVGALFGMGRVRRNAA